MTNESANTCALPSAINDRGGWLRGILANDYALDFFRVQWVPFEHGHVAEAKAPPGVIRAAADRDMTAMRINGELDAAIDGAERPKDPHLRRPKFGLRESKAGRLLFNHWQKPENWAIHRA